MPRVVHKVCTPKDCYMKFIPKSVKKLLTAFRPQRDNFEYTFYCFLKLLKARVTRTGATRFLETHPDSSSMMAYTAALDHFNIANAALQLNKEDLQHIPTPLITFSRINGGTFQLVKDIKEDGICWLDTQQGWIEDSYEMFLRNWSGVVLLAEVDETSGEKKFEKKRRAEFISNVRLPLAITLFALVVLGLVLNMNPFSEFISVFLVLKLFGMLLASLLFVKSIDSTNNFVNKLCNAGATFNCQSILDSPASKITSWFSWSDAGFIYFYGSFFGILLSHYKAISLNTFLGLQLIFSTSSLLFSTYSLFYQRFKAKMWCPFCLGVVAVLLAEFVLITVTFPLEDFVLDATSILQVFMGFMVPVIFLLLFKNTAINAKENTKATKELNALKANPKIIRSLFEGQREMPFIPQDLEVVTIGKRNAPNSITIVSNPLCTPCANMHARIAHLLAHNEHINCKVIFLSNPDKNDPGGQFVRKVQSLPKTLQSKALDEWYARNDRNFTTWNEAYHRYAEREHMPNLQQKQNEWANQAEATRTPTLFFNGKLVPETVKVEDLALQLVHLKQVEPNYGFANHEL